MYERMGGGGIPKGMEGKDIPMGARILAVVDVYADLTSNSNNAMGKLMSADEAVALLFDYSSPREGASDKPEIFDRHIIEVLAKSTGGERIVIDLLGDRHRVLIVDPDPEETMVLQLRLAEQGFDVHLARTLAEARTAIEARAYAVIVSEVDLDEPGAGFELKKAVAKRTKGSSWMFLSTHGSRDTVRRAFQLGVDDFLNKPIATEIVVAKLTQMVERQATKVGPRGVSGSLSEMGLTDLVQVLWHGRKTCALRVSQADRKGEIHFDKGRIVNAKWDDVVGEKAFFRILSIGEDGEFAVDPEFVPGKAVITHSPEALLLEGMRLLDEGIVP
jgi:DNA-binding response OmpR family regulator